MSLRLSAISLATASLLCACGGGSAPEALDSNTNTSEPTQASAMELSGSLPSLKTLTQQLQIPHSPKTLLLTYTPFTNASTPLSNALSGLVTSGVISSFSTAPEIHSATLTLIEPLDSLSPEKILALFKTIQVATSPNFASLSLDFTSSLDASSDTPATADTPQTTTTLSTAATSAYLISRNTPSWGLDRLDQSSLPINGRFNNASPGTGVNVYTLGSGVKQTNPEVFGRTKLDAPNFASDSPSADSCYTEGTHSASLIAGATFGVASLATLYPVRTSSCSGTTSTSNILSALAWILSHATNDARKTTPAVVYIPYAISASDPLDTAVKNLLAAGIHVVAPSGDNASDACNYSPARVPGVITTASTNSTDFSEPSNNLGTCVQMFAPGKDIQGALATNSLSSLKRSGSAVAAAFTAGSVASLLQNQPKAKTSDMLDLLTSFSQAGQIKYNPSLPSALSELALLTPDHFLQIGTVLAGKTNILSRSIHLTNASFTTALLPYSKWTSNLSFTVRDKADSPVQGASVQGFFQSNPSVMASCLTGPDGSCSIASRPVLDSTAADSFALKTVSAPAKLYAPDANTVSSTTLSIPNPGRKKIFIKNLSEQDNPSQTSSTSWYKTVTATISASDNSPAPDVKISFALPSNPNTVYTSCTTNSSGQCSFPILMTPATNVQTFKVLKVEAPLAIYSPELNSSSSITVTGPATSTAYVTNLYGSSSPRSDSSWNASVTAVVTRSDNKSPANITLNFKVFGNRTMGCTTDSSGSCSINYVLPSNITMNSAYVTNLTGPYLTYTPKYNRIEQVTVYRPTSD